MDLNPALEELPFSSETLILIILWELFWKGLALWQAAKKDHKFWFVLILVLNTLGILPIGYILWQKRTTKKKESLT
jgi:hypothetical protein